MMKRGIPTIIIAALAVASICLAESAGSLPNSDKRPPTTLQEIHSEVLKTQAELQRALTRIAVLEKQVSSLQQANVKLEQTVQSLGQPRLIPLERR